MRSGVLTILLLGSMVLGLGCTRSTSEAALMEKRPIPAELPAMSPVPEPTVTYYVGVEGRQPAPRMQLVAPLPEPEYTPEEKAILAAGKRPQTVDFLEFYVPPNPRGLVSTDRGGPLPGIAGVGGVRPGIDPRTATVGLGGFGGAQPGVVSASRTVGRTDELGGARPGREPARRLFGYDPATHVVGRPQHIVP